MAAPHHAQSSATCAPRVVHASDTANVLGSIGTYSLHRDVPRLPRGCSRRAVLTRMPHSPTTAELAEAIAEAEASANDSAEARAWLALLAEVLDQVDD
jgi:hypothetical protein